MRNRLSLTGFAFAAFLAVPVPTLGATPARIVASDARGVTVRLDVPQWRLTPGTEAGVQRLVVPGFEVGDVPGRAGMPFLSVLIALPQGARAEARVEQQAAWEDLGPVALEIAGKPEFQPDSKLGMVPVRTKVPAIVDGPWPRTLVEVGEPFSLRRQRMTAVLIRPFQWDASTRGLRATRSLTVRVDFVGGSGTATQASGPSAEDRHWESVLEGAVMNYDQARGWRSSPTRASRQPRATTLEGGVTPLPISAEDDFPEVRVKLDTTGVYELPYSELSAKGYPANIPIAQVSVHRHEFVQGANPPFVSIELPIQVRDLNSNGIFDNADRIVLWVQNWAERARATWPQRNWGDAEVVYATAVTGTALRMPTRPGWRNVPGLTPLASYPWKQHWEGNYNYYLFPPDTLTDQFHWTEIEVYYERPDTFAFETNHLDTTRAATISASWVGRKVGPHVSWAQFRKLGGPFITVADSVFWFGTIAMTSTVTVPGSTLGEGDVNRMAVWGKGSTAPPGPTNSFDNVGFNWIEATYWRRFQALEDYLSCNTGSASGETQIRASGFTQSGISVYDVTDSIAPVALTIDPSHVQFVGGSYQVEFQDLVGSGETRRYVAFVTGKSVPPESYSAVTRNHLTSTPVDYLLVVPEAFLPAVADLVTLRQSQGLRVLLAPLESLFDEFNGGRRSDFGIKRLVRYAYDNWDTKFLLLFGDGTEDPQNLMKESSPDIIPVHKISGPVQIQFGFEIIPSDPWYVCMENCDLIAGPVLQDLFVGRIPVQTLADAQSVVAKLVAYENFSSSQTWRQKLLLSSDDAFSAETFFGGGGAQVGYCYRPGEVVFRQLNESVADLIRGAGLQQAVIDTFHLDSKLAGVACSPSTPDCSCKDQATVQQITHSSITPQLISRLNEGRMWWNFQGHANEFVLAHEDLYLNRGFQDDKDVLLNGGKPFLFSAFSCHANAFARFADQAIGRGPALGEEMMALPSTGAIGSWASTGYEILPFSGSSHINVAWARAMFEDPPHDPYLGDRGARVVLGETIALALARYVPTVVFNPNERGIGLSYHLLGDPATRLSIGPPEAIVTANQLPVTSGQPVRLHTLGDTLRLEADLVSNVRLESIALDRSDASGLVTIPPAQYTITPAFPDTAVDGEGGRRYHVSYSTTLEPESHTFVFRTTDRYGVSGRFEVIFQFLTQLLLDTSVLAEDDPVPPNGNVSLRLFSPKPLVPVSDLTLTVNGVTQPFVANPVAGDPSGREWILSWSHGAYPIDRYEVVLNVAGGGTYTHHFRVLVGGTGLQVQNPIVFPNPFDEGGAAFSFFLVSGANTDVQIRVFTTAGRLIYERDERGLSPGYHQLPWNGRDDEGDELSNGVYVFKVLATNGESKAEHIGRLVKLRKPHRADSP